MGEQCPRTRIGRRVALWNFESSLEKGRLYERSVGCDCLSGSTARDRDDRDIDSEATCGSEIARRTRHYYAVLPLALDRLN